MDSPADPVPRVTRRLWLLVMVLVGVAVPLGPAVVAAGVPGGGPDVVSTLWGMWWFQQAGAAMPLGGETTLVNHPFGAHGVVLSPSTAALWSVCEPWLGSGRSASLVVAAVLVALVAGVGMLARAAGVGPAGAAVAASALLVGRYLVFGAGEGSVVAIANVPLPLGLAALVWLARGRGGAGAAAALAACTVAVATENPYLAPVLPTVTAVVTGTRIGRNKRLERVDALSLGGALVGGVGVVLVAGLFGRAASPDYPREVAGTLLSLGTWDFTVVDLPWARVRPSEVLWGGPVRWTVDAAGGVAAGGGRTLGITVLGMALIGGVRAPEARPWLALGAGCFVVSLGSQVGDLGTPFLYLNTVMAEVARPLTQPVRFLAVTQIAVAVAAGFGAEVLLARAGRSAGLAVGGAMLLECAFLGGGSLRMPVTALPEAACVEDLEPGAVLVWPWDARDGEPSVAQLLQLQHEQAAVHPGIASWRQLERSAIQRVRAMGVTDRGRSEEPLQLGRLDQHGYRWIIVDEEADPQGRARMRPQLGRPIAECPGFAVFDIRRPAMGPLD